MLNYGVTSSNPPPPRPCKVVERMGGSFRCITQKEPRTEPNITRFLQQIACTSDDESASVGMSVLFASSSEEDCNEVFTDSCSEAQDCSDNMTPTSCRRFCIHSNIIPARPPRFEFKASLGAITVSFPLNNLSFLTLTLTMNFFALPWRDKLACPSAAEFE